MIKKIPVSQARVGMYLHKVEGHWIRHPFWRSSFALSDSAVIDKLATAGITQIWIDTERGFDTQAPCADDVPQASSQASPQASSQSAAASSAVSIRARDPSDTFRRARKLSASGKGMMSDIFRQARLGRAVDPQAALPLVEAITESVIEDPCALISLLRLRSADEYTYAHSVAVCALMIALSRQLQLDTVRTREAGLGGLMHDLGKARIPNEILNKPGPLTAPEFAVISTHPQAGQLMLASAGASAAVQDVCLHHHERVDGTGYPDRLAGDSISLLARMGAVCDVYDAITANRPYKQAWDPGESIRKMAAWRGHFDEAVFKAFVRCVGIYPVGSLVRLASERLAVVLQVSAQSLTRPQVRVFYSLRSREPIPLELIDLDAPRCTDRIVGPEDPAPWRQANLERLWLPD